MSSPSPTTTTTHSSLGRRAGFPQAADMKPFRVRWISSGTSRLALVPAVLATALLMASTASAQLFTSTTSTGNWFNSAGTAGRWSTTSSGPFGSNYVSGSNTSFTTAGTYTFDRLVTTGSATLGNITTVDDVNIAFTTNSSQVLNFGGAGGALKTLDFGARSVVDFGAITTVAGNGITKSGAGTLMLTGGAYTGGFTLNAGNVIARSANALGNGNIVINGGAIGSTQSIGLVARATGKTITVAGDFQLGTSDTFNGAATDGFNIAFTAANNGLNLNGGARTITLGSSGSMTFGQSITNGSLTLNRRSGASAGQFGLSAANTISSLTLDSVKVNALTNNAALGSGNVTLQGADATTLNIQGARTIGNAFTIADSAGTKTITGNNNSGNITGTITNNDDTGGLVIGSIGATNFTVGAIDGAGTTGVTFGSSTLLGTVTMSGVSSYAGDTRIDSSVLKMSGGGAVPNGKLVFQGTGAATFDLNGTTQTVAKLDDSALAGIIRSSAVGGQLIVGDGTDSTFAGTIVSGASLGLEKRGSGKLTLTGANTYSGGTTITAGELEVNFLATQPVTNNAVLTFNPDAPRTFAGAIDGSGSVTKIGTDDLTLTGANTYLGGTTVTAGNLIGTTDSLQGAIANNATVTFRQSAAGTYAGVMSGGGALVKEGSGNVELTGLNTYNGGTTITGGGLTASTGSLPLNGNVDAAAGTTLTFDQNSAGTFGGVLSGDGALVKLGSGAVTLTGANTYTGGNTITAGNLIGSTTTILGATTVDSGATLTLNDTSAATFAGDITGAGALAKTGAGNVTLSGANTYTGGTTVSAGGLTGSIDNLQGDIVADTGTTVTFDQGVDGAYAGVLSGAGKLIKDGAGILTVSGANTYTGNTEVLDGTLLGTTSNVRGNIAVSAGANVSFDNTAAGSVAGNVTGAGSLSVVAGEVTLAGTNTYSGGTTVLGGELKGTATSIQGAIVNNSAVTIDGAGTYGGVMSGNGSLTKTGVGDLTLTAANTYSGGTTVSGGNLIGTTTSLTGDITAATGTLVKISQATDGTYAGAISGAGGLSKLGVGVVTLTQEQLYTGATNVDAGTLLLGGNLATSGITVANGATLGGSGATAANLIANGTLKPGVGATPGSLEAAGITLGSSSTTDLRLVADGTGDAGLAGINYSTVIAASTLVYGGNLVIRFDNTNLYDDYSTFSLFSAATYDVSANGGQGFAGITVGGTGPYSGLTFTYNPSVGGSEAIWVTGDTSSEQYMVFHPTSGTLVIVPEPSTWAMTLASVGFAGWMARRKKLASKKQRQLAA